MAKKRLLYISTNDGSDTRINKEIKTLSRHFDVDFLGIGFEGRAFVKENCNNFYLVNGSRKKLWLWVKLMFNVYYLLWKNNYNSLHLINEQLLLMLYPILFFKYAAVDLFDSFFLKTNYRGVLIEVIRRFLFFPVNKIIVTDDNRKSLMPSYLHRKISVVENYPSRFSFEMQKRNDDKLVIFYAGWVGRNRGTAIIKELLESYNDVEVWMVGWFADGFTRELLDNKNVKYWGVLPQVETMKLAAQADYILCLYAPVHENNVNASPNKIYDAIQVDTPVIINQEVKVSNFVREYNLGVVISEFNVNDIKMLYNELRKMKGSFLFSQELKDVYCWEKIEYKLLDSHV